MKKLILIVIVLLPGLVGAASDCRVVDFQDHYEAVCDGEAASTPAPQPATVTAAPVPELPPPPPVQASTPSFPETERVTVQTSRSAGSYRQRKTSH
ncbi:hypothetical protein [Geomesophilobacter sediminis]|uniref:Secreted protein n=1 Tax=Geomesophilobacter sediminis TaxID=2798584 RepID=A0A8J7LZ24_9BACT|nr:hypothetical protein [Geomesophilobacter sediminis]MBJ6725977.1 hypothetical protein [Geomesophilobacter sediminis]